MHDSVLGVNEGCCVFRFESGTDNDIDNLTCIVYGIVDGSEIVKGIYRLNGIVEKPQPKDAPSNLAVVGRYVLSSDIFAHIRNLKPGAGGEIQLTDAIASLLKVEPVFAYEYDGVRYDCGSKLGYLKASVEFALRHPEVADDFAAYLKSRSLT